MSKYHILAETGGDLTAEMIRRYNIEIVAMHVTFGTVTKPDGTFPVTDLFDYYKKNGKLPKTAAANSVDFEEAFDRVHEKYPDEHILYLAYSAQTTSSFQNALIAMEGRDYVTAIDTRHVSAGQAMFVTRMAQYIEEHPDISIDEIKERAEKLSDDVEMGFFPGDLDYLRAGGRVSNAAYLGARLLNLSPLIELNHGLLVASKKYRGNMKKIAPKLVRNFVEGKNFSKEEIFLIFSAGLDQKIKDETQGIALELGFKKVTWVETGCVVSTHSGPAAFGVVGFRDNWKK